MFFLFYCKLPLEKRSKPLKLKGLMHRLSFVYTGKNTKLLEISYCSLNMTGAMSSVYSQDSDHFAHLSSLICLHLPSLEIHGFRVSPGGQGSFFLICLTANAV